MFKYKNCSKTKSVHIINKKNKKKKIGKKQQKPQIQQRTKRKPKKPKKPMRPASLMDRGSYPRPCVRALIVHTLGGI
jgi:hypothetical protein